MERVIGTVYAGDGQVNDFRNHRLVGTKWARRWFAETNDGSRLGPKPPYEEGFSSRLEATVELISVVLKVRRGLRESY